MRPHQSGLMPFMNKISRRTMLSRSSLLLAAGGVLEGSSGAAAAASAAKRLKLIFTGGHPGDPEYGCGGTILRYAEAGHDVLLLYLNRGEPRDKRAEKLGDTREAEAKAACK